MVRFFHDDLCVSIITLCAGRLINVTKQWREAQETRMVATSAGGAAPTAGAFVVKRICVLAVLAQPRDNVCFLLRTCNCRETVAKRKLSENFEADKAP